ncbi:MAG: ABC transporter ATP-binding protein uup [Hyphomicrobiaceae bacterium hypho_1]
MSRLILSLKNVYLTFGGTPLLIGADLQVSKRDRIGLVGRNGSGKSTLLKIAAGIIEADSAEHYMQPGIRVEYLPQEPDLTGYATVHDYVKDVFDYGEDSYRAQSLLSKLGLSGLEKTVHLSGGQARRAALARSLASKPDLLLLDEPTNHLDLTAIQWLEKELAAMSSAIVLISHDRCFLEKLTQTTVWLNGGQSLLLNKGFSDFEVWRDKILDQEIQEIHKFNRKITREEQWMHGGVSARRKRNVKRVAELIKMRQARKDRRRQIGTVSMVASDANLSGKMVFEVKNLAKSFNANHVVKDFSLRVARGDRIGIIGPNGVGKTTLLKLILGDLQADSGTIRRGSNLEVVTLDQNREMLNPEEMLSHAIMGGAGDTVTINGRSRHFSSYMKDFLFLTEQARSPLKVLSGGERARVQLARAFAKPSNLLVLDEPTNDLDLETLDLLQELIADYSGTVILVSHDRSFLDRTVTSVITTSGNGQWVEYAGSCSDMLAQLESDVFAESSETFRSAFKLGKKKKASSMLMDQSRSISNKTSRKLSFNDKYALKKLSEKIEKLTSEINEMERELDDPSLYVKFHERFNLLSARLGAAKIELDEVENAWLKLEIKREELEC